jgi:hypothetical protein
MDTDDISRDPETGQFTSSLSDHIRAEHARLEFTPMEDNRPPKDEDNAPTYGSSDQEIRAAAAEMQAKRGVELEAPEAIVWHDRYGDLLPYNISTTKDQAAEALNAYRQAKAEAAQGAQDRDLKAAIDAPRIELEVTDPKNARLYQFDNELERAVGEFAAEMGVETPATQPTVEAAPEQQPARESGLDPDLAKVIEHPQVRAMLESELGRYEQAIQEAGLYAQSSLLDHFPELAQIDRSQWPMAIELINKQTPERVQRGMNVINRAVAIGAEQQRLSEAHQARQNAQRQQEIEKWSRQEGARYDQWAQREGLDMATFPQAASKYIETHLGMDRAQFAAVLRDNPVLRASGFQQVLSDAVRYRQGQEARKNIAAKPLPPAIRPGAQAPGVSSTSNSGRIAELTRQLNNASGQQALRIAAALTSARRKG